MPDGALNGVRYAVFGCGNRDWASTYQAVPTAVDENLARAGARRLMARGAANARGDFFGDFDDWHARLWEPMAVEFNQDTQAMAPAPRLEVEFVGTTRDPLLRQNQLRQGTVVTNRELVADTDPKGRSKRHIEIALPAGEHYQVGDYLTVLPRNPAAVVERALGRFGLAYDTQIVLRNHGGTQTRLPIDVPVVAGEVLAGQVELSQPATRQQIAQLIAATDCPPDKRALQALVADAHAYAATVFNIRVTVLDLLERYPAVQLPFGSFLQLLSPLTPRQYSISSTPRWREDHVTVTVAVLRTPACPEPAPTRVPPRPTWPAPGPGPRSRSPSARQMFPSGHQSPWLPRSS